MAIDRSGPTASLVAALQADITRRSERNRRQHAEAAIGAHRDASALRRQLADIMRTTPDDDPQAQDAAQRRVIEAVLRWELGGRIASPMIEQLARTLQADPRHRERFDRLVRELQQR